MFDYISINNSGQLGNLWNFFSTLLGASVGAFATYKAVDKSYKRNLEIEAKKKEEKEKIVLASMLAELKVLKDIYEKEMSQLFDNLEKVPYLESVYIASYDYTTIYTHNAENIGFINDEKLRNLIIEVHIRIKVMLENFVLYRDELNKLYDNRLVFISKVFPHQVHEQCFYLDIGNEINKIKEYVADGNWNWANSSILNKEQISNFLISDNALIQSLVDYSNLTKEQYSVIRSLINEILEYSIQE